MYKLREIFLYFPLRIFLPVSILMLVFIISLIIFYIDYKQSIQYEKEIHIKNFSLKLDLYQQQIEYFILKSEHIELIDKIIVSAYTDDRIKEIFLVDPEDKIIASHQKKKINEIYKISELNKEGCYFVQNEIGQCLAQIEFSNYKRGWLYILFSLERDVEILYWKLLRKYLRQIFIMFLITFIFYRTYNSLITEKLEEMIEYLKKLELGGEKEELSYFGFSEFAILSRSLNNVAKKIWNLVHLDYLTKIYNRFALEKKINLELENSKFFLMGMIDFDNFKIYNDIYGHEMGDLILIAFAERLKVIGNKYNLLFGRFGGDEFVFFRNGEMNLLSFIEEFTSYMNPAYYLRNNVIQLKFSTGIVYREKRDSDNFYKILNECDFALLESKKKGKNQISFFNERLMLAETKNNILMNDILYAMERNQFFLVYQPIYDRDKKIYGFESLMRWHHHNLGIISPKDFIHLMNITNQHKQFFEFVLQKTFSDLGNYQQFMLHINISVTQLLIPELKDMILYYCNRFNIPCNRMNLEIIEYEILQEKENLKKLIKELKQYGIQFSIDDFGTGYANFSYILDFDIDILKIDKSLIQDLTENVRRQKIVESIIQVCNAFNIKTVVEGVETESQFELLKLKNVDYFQGFLLSKPQEIENIKSWI